MLQKIVGSTGFGSLLLLDDESTAQSGSRLLNNVIASFQGGSGCILFHDGVSISGQRLIPGNCIMTTLSSFECDEICEQIDRSNMVSAVGVDCISSITFLHGCSEVATLLRRIRDLNRDVKFIGHAHRDVLVSETAINELSSLFDTVVELEPYSISRDASYHCLASCLKREHSGKIMNTKEALTWNTEGMLVCHSMITSSSSVDEDGSNKAVLDRLTFNLNLSDMEKQERNAVKLPYLKKDSEKNILLSKSDSTGKPAISISFDTKPASVTSPAVGGSKIYYQYDDADDFDDEDPDDDLNI